MTSPQAVLDFWFGELDANGAPIENKSPLWWGRSEETDAEIIARFGATAEAAANGELDHWADTPSGAVALIITLDQFPRNMYRGQSQAFATDAKARTFTLAGIAAGNDQQMPFAHRVFFYIPLEHSEDRALQAQSVELYAHLMETAPPALKEQAANYLDYAKHHRAIVDRFGHFPHRNDFLGRESTAEEIEFLTRPGSSF